MTDIHTTISVNEDDKQALDEAKQRLFDDPDDASYADVVEALVASKKYELN